MKVSYLKINKLDDLKIYEPWGRGGQMNRG